MPPHEIETIDPTEHQAVVKSGPRPSVSSRDGPAEISVVSVVNVVLRQRDLVIRTTVLLFLVVVGVGLITPRSYTSASSFMPQSRQQPGNLAGITAQLGLILPTSERSESPSFYADLLRSREILGTAVTTRYTFVSDTGAIAGDLLELYGIKGNSGARRLDGAIRRLRGDITTSLNRQTTVIALTVAMRYPHLSQQINQRLLDLVNRFNLETRQTQAAAERRFTEQRLEEGRDDLREAEDRLLTFLQRNRDYIDSPELTFEQDRLAREVAMQQLLFTSMSQAYEQAKIDEVRDTPVITVVERPQIPARPDRRGLITKGLMALIVGTTIGVLLVFAVEFMRNTTAEGEGELAEFTRLRRDAFNDIRRPWRPVVRLFTRRR